MQLTIMPEVFSLFPTMVQYTLVAKGVNNKGEAPELELLLREAEEAIRENSSFEDIKVHPMIASWRDAFTSFGINPNQCPPSVANLIKRTRSGKDLPFVNKLVCIFNIISLSYVIPAGGDDIGCLKGDLILGPATGDEEYTPLGGGKTEFPKVGEIILYDATAKIAFCRAWCWKNGDVSKITEESSHAAINLNILPPASAEAGSEAAEKMALLIKEYCGGDITVHRLDAGNRALYLK